MDRYRSSFRPESVSYDKKPLVTSLFLAALPGIIGFGVLIASVIIIDWQQTISVSTSANNLQIVGYGLFTVCTRSTTIADEQTRNQCTPREELATNGLPVDPLEQATRSLIIIAIILSFGGTLVTIFLGIRRMRREYGPIASGAVFGLAALCAIAGMACYSAFLTNNISDAGKDSATYTTIEAGTSFYLGWFGTTCLILACIIAFVSYAL